MPADLICPVPDGGNPAALGYAEASDLGVSTFAGQTVDSDTLVIRYTWFGDCNLNGDVDLNDFAYVVANFNTYTQKWLYGDVNYDGFVDLTDFTILAANFNTVLLPAAGAAPVAPAPRAAAPMALSFQAPPVTLSRRLIDAVVPDHAPASGSY